MSDEPGDPQRTGALSDRISDAVSDRDLTLADLARVLDDGSIALVLMVLLIPSALPIPTGGVTHVLELAALLVAAQLALGRDRLWLPSRLARHQLGSRFKDKGARKLVGVVRWFERFTRPRGAAVLATRPARMLLGVALMVLVLGAFLAPPFSGFDTLPSLGVVLIAIGLLFGDGLVVGAGLLVGATGLAVVLALGSLAWSFLR
jgi:hypothetical protein